MRRGASVDVSTVQRSWRVVGDRVFFDQKVKDALEVLPRTHICGCAVLAFLLYSALFCLKQHAPNRLDSSRSSQVPSMRLIQQALTYAKELERIV